MPPVGNGCTQIGYLQRGRKNFSLSDSDTDYRKSVPRAPICFIIKLGVRNQAALLSGKVGTKAIAESLRHHMVFPYGNGILRRTVLLVAEHTEQPPTKIRVARSGYCRNQRQRRTVPMTAYMQTSIIETVCTRESRIIFMDYSFLQKCQCLRSLESRARRIRTHDCAVQERFPLVSLQHPVILSTLASNHQVRIESRRRNHTEYLSRSRFNGYDSSDFMLQQTLT